MPIEAPWLSIHGGRSASCFAFDLLYDANPDALEIVEVKGGHRKIAWSYLRPEDG